MTSATCCRNERRTLARRERIEVIESELRRLTGERRSRKAWLHPPAGTRHDRRAAWRNWSCRPPMVRSAWRFYGAAATFLQSFLATRLAGGGT